MSNLVDLFNSRNIFIYWIGKEYKLIKILRELIYLHQNNGQGYKVHFINQDNIKQYLHELPNYFYDLLPAHQADFIRVNVIYDYGGIWLDSDTLVIDSLDSLFDIINSRDGFFIKENNHNLLNGIFGSKKNTPLMKIWKKQMRDILDIKKNNIYWTEIGNVLLETIKNNNPDLYSNYKIFDGLDNLYPINWDNCVTEFIEKPYENYQNIVRSYQPLVVLVNSVYKRLDDMTYDEILEGNMSLNYFINKSYENLGRVKNNYKNIFENIYKSSVWNNGDLNIPSSGPGSSLENTKHIINKLTDFIYNNNCKSILDLGCGDLTWISTTRFFNDNNILYTGVDIVDNLIKTHSKKYPNNRFYCEDVINYHINTKYSLIIIRDVIFHLKNTDILSIFNNIKNNFNFIAITSCRNKINNDEFNQWHFSELNLHILPFNIPLNYLMKIEEPTFNRDFYIYHHDEFYNTLRSES